MGSNIDVGDHAPDFTLPDHQGNERTLSEELENGPVMLVFYPGDFTPVCSRQLCSYRDSYDEFAELGITILGISDDPTDSHREFRDKKSFPFPLLSDPDHEVIDRYGGAGLLSAGSAHRANYIIDSDGIVRYAHVEKLGVFYRDADEMLDAARQVVGAEG